MEFLINGCLHLVVFLEPSVSPSEQPFTKAVWDHLYSDGLSLRLQATVLLKPFGENRDDWKSELFEALRQDNVFKAKNFKFEFIHGLNNCIKYDVDKSETAEATYLRLIKQRPDDLNIILWYTLLFIGEGEESTDADSILPLPRVKVIVDCMFS